MSASNFTEPKPEKKADDTSQHTQGRRRRLRGEENCPAKSELNDALNAGDEDYPNRR